MFYYRICREDCLPTQKDQICPNKTQEKSSFSLHYLFSLWTNRRTWNSRIRCHFRVDKGKGDWDRDLCIRSHENLGKFCWLSDSPVRGFVCMCVCVCPSVQVCMESETGSWGRWNVRLGKEVNKSSSQTQCSSDCGFLKGCCL